MRTLKKMGMSESETYRIPYLGLKNGMHLYEFDADETFFSKFEQSLLLKAKVNYEVQLEKLSTHINLEIDLVGLVGTQCDTCGADLTSQIEGDFRVVVKFGDETSDLTDDLIVLGPNEHYVNLDQLFFEFAHLCLPSRNVHENELDCNQEALAALKKFKIKEKDEDIDPRWAALKNLK